MTAIRLLLLKKTTTPCRSCGALIDWYETPSGRPMPMNAGAQPLNPIVNLAMPIASFDSAGTHWATCPDAATWKARR